MSAYDDITEGLDEIRRSAFVSGTTKKSYRQASPQESPRVFAYLDGGAEPSPFPTTLMGSGLTKVERGRRALAPKPPPSSIMRGVSYMRWGSGELPTAHVADYDALLVGWAGFANAGAQTARSSCYMSAVSCLENAGWHYGVTGEDALANGWVLKQGTRLLRNAGYPSSYIGDPGSAGYQQRWADNVIAICQSKNLDGVFIDDFYGSLSLADGTPDKYPTIPVQRSACLSFIQAVYPRLHAAGLFVWTNSVVYEGQTGDDQGTTTIPWWQMIAPYVDGLSAEYWQWRNNSPTFIRKSGPEWYSNWDTWQALPAFCEANGKEFMGILYADNYGRPSSDKMYVLCSMLLETENGSIVGGSSSLNPWISDYDRLPLGPPQGAKVKNGNRWQRQYEHGLVWVDPVAGTAGID